MLQRFADPAAIAAEIQRKAEAKSTQADIIPLWRRRGACSRPTQARQMRLERPSQAEGSATLAAVVGTWPCHPAFDEFKRGTKIERWDDEQRQQCGQQRSSGHNSRQAPLDVAAKRRPIGKHATYYPEVLKQVVAAGHTVGSHTWSHADLEAVMKKSGPDAAKEEIEKGASAVHMMAGAPIAPFFRFPDLRHPPEMLTHLAERNIASFSTDIDSWDFKIKKPEELIKSLMGKLQKQGKAIILMHDFQKVTSIALPQILGQLQKNGFKVVHMVPKGTLTTLPQFDEAVLKENKLPTLTKKPTDSVVRTIE